VVLIHITQIQDDVKQLSAFTDLTCIEFRIHADAEAYMSSRDKELVNMAEAILQDKPSVDGLLKWVVLKFDNTSHRIHIP
jgi:hypothetical protein